MKTIVCSHGFGVKADARGMFTDIAAAFPGYDFKMFDYNQFLENGYVVVAPLADQAKKLQAVLDEQSDDVVLLAHSQGCIVAGLVDLTKVSEVILLAPPVEMSMQHVIGKMMKRPGSLINLDGVSKFPRSDGLTTHLPKEYIQGLNNVPHPLDLYQTIANSRPTTIIRAANDHVLGLTNVDTITGDSLIDLDADHDFTGESRIALINTLKSILPLRKR